MPPVTAHQPDRIVTYFILLLNKKNTSLLKQTTFTLLVLPLRMALSSCLEGYVKDGVTVHDEQDVLITCQGEPLFIGVHNQHGTYLIPLTQHRGQWQPRKPTKKAKQALSQANSMYDIPSIEQAVKWMHAVCG